MVACLTCQLAPAVLAGTATRDEVNHWSMWGCTCEPEPEPTVYVSGLGTWGTRSW